MVPEDPLLQVSGLTIPLPPGGDRQHAVEDVGFKIFAGRTLCVVGESGSGKSVTAHSLPRLLPRLRPSRGTAKLRGRGDLLSMSERELRAVRGRDIGMVFQEPMTSLNPLMPVGRQIEEVLRCHGIHDPKEWPDRVAAMIGSVGLPSPAAVARAFPHELSGGQRQRVAIAISLILNPSLLIADEPTTALDVTTQRQILELIKEIQESRGMAVLFITHDFGVVADIADEIVVMRHGRVVEAGIKADILEQPSTAYTKELIAAVLRSRKRASGAAASAPILLNIANLRKSYRTGSDWFSSSRRTTALDSVDLDIRVGETVAVVGESGSGKSTLARCVTRLVQPDSGDISLAEPRSVASGVASNRIQMVFQDPYASLNPKRAVGDAIAAGPIAHGTPRDQAVTEAKELLDRVGLSPGAFDRLPNEFSGGQRQRICIARALALRPSLLVADEPVSALDVSVQAQVLELLSELQRTIKLAMLFITHDLRVAGQVADRIVVMRNGQIVEQGITGDVLDAPSHPYTRQLMDAVPGRRWMRRMSEVPDAVTE